MSKYSVAERNGLFYVIQHNSNHPIPRMLVGGNFATEQKAKDFIVELEEQDRKEAK